MTGGAESPSPYVVPFWKTKLAVHQANPSGTCTPPMLLQKSEINHVPGPMPTGGRSTPAGVAGTVPDVGALPVVERHDPLPAAGPPELPVCSAATSLSGTPCVPAATTRS